jgi:SAM-dependent methyltransferase
MQKYQLYPVPRDERWLDRLISQVRVSPGMCPICGHATVFWKFSDNLRETGICVFCRSTNRHRQIASVFLNAISEQLEVHFSSIHHFISKARKYQKLTIYNTETCNPLHQQLKAYPGYIASEYMGEQYQSGEVVQQILHQDLMATSFASNSIDVMVSSDVFEHIPDPYQAFAEVHRILKPGGKHIFTVPFYQEAYRDEVRTVLATDGTLQHLLPPIYHHDPLRPEGIIVFTIFSMEMLLKLSDLGYETRMYRLHDFWQGILGANAIVFESTKVNVE